MCRVKAKNTDKNMRLRVRFFGKTRKRIEKGLNPKTDFAFFGGNPKSILEEDTSDLI